MLLNESRAQSILAAAGIDAIVATSKENVAYLTGHDNPTHNLMKNSLICAIYSPGSEPKASAIIPTLEVETYLQCEPWIDDVYLVGFFARAQGHGQPLDEMGTAGRKLIEGAHRAPTAMEALKQAIESRGLQQSRIAIDESGMSFSDWNEINRSFPKAEIVPGNSILWEIRMVKSPEEIDRLRKSSEIAERAVELALRDLRPGMSEADLLASYNAHVSSMGALPSFGMFGAGSRTSQPHLISSQNKLGEGDLIRWDIGCTYQMYHSDTARAVVFGEPKEHQSRVWNLLADGVEGAIELVRPGADPANLYRAAIAPLEKSGMDDFKRFHCGHGIGIAIYDPPIVTEDDPSKSVFRVPIADGGLEPGMVINIEVGYYQQGFQGFLCEDTLVVVENGFERLTTASKKLALKEYLS